MYASLPDVQAYCPMRNLAAGSAPNPTQVRQLIEDTAAVIDGIVAGLGYDAPVDPSATAATAVLKVGNTLGAWCAVERAAPVSDDADAACERWAGWQADLKAGVIELPGIGQSADRYARVWEGAASPMFTRDMEL